MAEKKRISIANKKAHFNFHVEQKYEAGIALTGSEVKSVRAQNVNMGDAYCSLIDEELYVKNMHISEFKMALEAHDPMRVRKLLLKKQELNKISQRIRAKGYTVFPIRLFENDKGLFKLEIGLGVGKKEFDKREDIKEKDLKREMDRYK